MKQPLSDLRVGSASADLIEHFSFAPGQPVRMALVAVRGRPAPI